MRSVRVPPLGFYLEDGGKGLLVLLVARDVYSAFVAHQDEVVP